MNNNLFDQQKEVASPYYNGASSLNRGASYKDIKKELMAEITNN